MDQWWESLVSKDTNGKTVFASSGKYVFTHITPGHEYIAGRDGMSDKVKKLYLPLVVKDQSQLRTDIEDALLEEARAKGTYIEDLEKEKSKAEYENLRLAYMSLRKDAVGLDRDYKISGDSKADFDQVINKLRTNLSDPTILATLSSLEA